MTRLNKEHKVSDSCTYNKEACFPIPSSLLPSRQVANINRPVASKFRSFILNGRPRRKSVILKLHPSFRVGLLEEQQLKIS
jgi:hypothetical protein